MWLFEVNDKTDDLFFLFLFPGIEVKEEFWFLPGLSQSIRVVPISSLLNKEKNESSLVKNEVISKDNKVNLLRKLRPKINPTSSGFFCDYCNYSTDKMDNLFVHIEMKHGTSEKPADKIKCDTCNRVYSSRNSWQKHKRFECGKQPNFFCQYCDYASTRKCNLKVHVYRHHERPKIKKNCAKSREVKKHK